MSSLTTQNTGDLILADHHNQIYNLLKGDASSGEAITLIYNAAGVIKMQPSSDPVASTELFIVNNNAGTRQLAITAGGDLVGTGGILTLPAGADTLVGLATTDTLTNKTLTSPVVNTQLTGTAVGTGASQVAAGNHTHAATGTTVVITKAEATTQFSTTSTSFVDATGLSIAPNVSDAGNDIEYQANLTVQTDGILTATYQIINTTDTVIIDSFPFRPAAGGTQESATLYRMTTQGTGAKTVKVQMKVASGTGYIGTASPDYATLVSKEYQ